MTKRSNDLMGVAVILAAVVSVVVLINPPSHAAKWELVVGETYYFAVDCLPAAVMPKGQAPDGQIVTASPCYVERMTVKSVSDDGWIEAFDPEGGKDALVWRVNLARVYALTKVATPSRRNL